MAWTANIKPIQTSPVYNDTLTIEVDYTNGQDTFTKSYNLHTEHFQDVSSVEDLIEQELQRLTKFDVVKTVLSSKTDAIIPMKAARRDVLKDIAVPQEINIDLEG